MRNSFFRRTSAFLLACLELVLGMHRFSDRVQQRSRRTRVRRLS